MSNLVSLLTQAVLSVPAQQGSRISGWVWVIIFIIAALVVWWLLTRATGEDPGIQAHHKPEVFEAEPAEPPTQAPEAIATEVPPQPLPAAPPTRAPEAMVTEVPPEPIPVEPSMPDDLIKIEGIGPKVNGVLQAAGIRTFAQLAAADIGKLKEVLEAAGYNYMDPASWPEQARLAAEGKWEEFEKLTASLKGGKKAS